MGRHKKSEVSVERPLLPGEFYYTVGEVSRSLGFANASVRRWAVEGKFGQDCIMAPGNNGEISIPQSGIEFFKESQRLFKR